jgi:hypothetical protein
MSMMADENVPRKSTTDVADRIAQIRRKKN